MESAQSLRLIQDMIAVAKKSHHRTSPYFLMWGTLMVFAGLGEFVFVYQVKSSLGYGVWAITGCIGGAYSIWYSKKEDKRQQLAKSFYDVVQQYVWASFTVSLIFTIALSVMHKINPTPYVLLLTAIPTFITGGLLKFNLFKAGGAIFWAAGITAFFVPIQYSSLIFSAAILLGYLVPGYQLSKKEKQ
jgi:hypothetical protein